MAKMFRSKDIRCPYYLFETPQLIHCSRLLDSIFPGLSFSDRAKHKRYRERYCQSCYADCPLYRCLLESRCGESDAQGGQKGTATMYELKQGADRLTSALYRHKEDAQVIQAVAAALNYLPAQLMEDIQALHDSSLQDQATPDGSSHDLGPDIRATEQIDSLTIKQARLPAGRSCTEAELTRAERALHSLLSCYQAGMLESGLRSKLTADTDHQTGRYCTHAEIMDVVELAKLVDAAVLLNKHLSSQIMRSLKRKAESGDLEAIEYLKAIEDL